MKRKEKRKKDHIDTTLIDLVLDMNTIIVNKKMSQYDDAYMYQATCKPHLKLNS